MIDIVATVDAAEVVDRQAALDRARIEAMGLPSSVWSVLLEAASECPDRVAVEFFEEGISLTYSALVDASLRQAAEFRAAGIAEGSPVVVMLPNCADWIISWMALMALGATIVPVNMRLTGRELAFIASDAVASHIIVDSSALSALADASLEIPAKNHFLRGAVADSGSRALGPGAHPLAIDDLPSPHPERLANIQFTSGSTGNPKGCLLPHRYWLIIGQATLEIYRPWPRRMLVYNPLFYMEGQVFIILGFFARASIFVAGRPSSSRFPSWMKTYNIDFCGFLPEIVFKQDKELDNPLPLLRAFTAGWDPANRVSATKRYGVPLYEMYGMTEIGGALYVPQTSVDLTDDATCGVEMPYQSCRIMLDVSREAPTNTVGELWVKGAAIFSGYHNRPEANSESFVDGWFRTGDLFRKDERGLFYYSGRIKDMIRRAGENISAQEVESVLRTLPLVSDVAIVGVPDDLRGQEVKAFVAFAPGVDPFTDPHVIDAFFQGAERSLAVFKLPRYVQPIADMPLTGSQKIDKPALRAMPVQPGGCYDRQLGAWIP